MLVYPTDPKSQRAIDEVDRRWSLLIAWDGDSPDHAKAHGYRPMLEHWREVQARIRQHEQQAGVAVVRVALGEEPVALPDWAELQGLAAELHSAEANAQAYGYQPPDGNAVQTPTWEDQHPIAHAVEQSLPDPASLPRLPSQDPYFGAKATAVGALALGTIAGAIAVRSDAAKAGVAVVGTLATAALAWAAFTRGGPVKGLT